MPLLAPVGLLLFPLLDNHCVSFPGWVSYRFPFAGNRRQAAQENVDE
jgi:hypothetical protein